jgi:hypothetical protein
MTRAKRSRTVRESSPRYAARRRAERLGYRFFAHRTGELTPRLDATDPVRAVRQTLGNLDAKDELRLNLSLYMQRFSAHPLEHRMKMMDVSSEAKVFARARIEERSSAGG